MKRSVLKRLVAFVLAFVMLITLIPVRPVQATDLQGQTMPMTEGEASGIVIENFVFEENDAVVKSEDEFHVSFDVNLEDGVEILASNCCLVFEHVIMGMQIGVMGQTVVESGEDHYEMTFSPLEDYVQGKWKVKGFYLCTDKQMSKYFDLSEELFSFRYSLAEVEGVSINNVTVSTDEVFLTEDVLETYVDVTADVTLETDTPPEELTLIFVDKDISYFIEANLEYDAVSGKYEGITLIDCQYIDAVYYLYEVWADGMSVEFTCNSAITVHNSITDDEAPLLEEIQLFVNGQQVENGAEVQVSDDVEFHFIIDEDSEVQQIYSSLVLYLQGGSKSYVNLSPVFSETYGCYVADVDFSLNDTATMWAIESVSLMDIYQNYEGGKTSEITYFYLLDENGACSVPTVETYFFVDGQRYSAMSEPITSMEKMFPDGIEGLPTEKNGRQLTAWCIDDQLYDNDAVFRTNGYLNAVPVYEGIEFQYQVWYVDENGRSNTYSATEFVECGTTFSEAFEIVKNKLELTHYSELTFANYKPGEINMYNIITPMRRSLAIEAEYEENGLFVTFVYRGEDSTEALVNKYVLVQDEVNCYGVMEALVGVDVSHMEGLGFSGWAYDSSSEGPYRDITGNYSELVLRAVYEKIPLLITCNYIDDNHRLQEMHIPVAVEPGTTYAEVVETYISIEHPEEFRFLEWSINAEGHVPEDEVQIDVPMTITPVYDAVLIENVISFIGVSGKEEVWKVMEPAQRTETYAQVMERVIERFQDRLPESIPFTGWQCSISDEELNQPIDGETTSISYHPIYEKKGVLVIMVYLDSKNEVAIIEEIVLLDEGTTYQQLENIMAEKCYHSPEAGFVEWHIDMDGINMDDVVPEYTEVAFVAGYERYPVVYEYDYLTKDNEQKTVTELVYVEAGTKVGEYLKNLELPDDSREDFANWYLEINADTIVGCTVTHVRAAAGYEEYEPYLTPLYYVNEMGEYIQGKLFYYLESNREIYSAVDDYETEMEKICGQYEGITLDRVNFAGKVEGSQDAEYGYYYGHKVYANAVYDGTIIEICYPDNTTEMVIWTEDFELPAKHNGMNIVWDVQWFLYYPGEKLLEPSEPVSTIFAFYDELPPTDMIGAQIADIIEKIEDAQAGETIIIDMTEQTVAWEVLEALKGKDVTLVFDMGDYAWSIHGFEVAADELKDICLQAEMDTDHIDQTFVDELAGEDEAFQMSLRHEGEFGLTAELSINVGAEKQGLYATLYYYAIDGTFEYMESVLVAENGEVTFVLEHASDYVVVLGEKRYIVENPFTDVSEDAYYFEPVLWAYANGITSGYTPTEFGTNGTCTRGEIVTFLWRAMGRPEPTTTINPFTDVPADAYYTEAVLWAYENGITSGLTETVFGPFEKCTREQIVTFLWRTMDRPEPTITYSFNDVAANEYYTKAVLWAKENGITSGLNATTFGTGKTCIRADVVSFLYRTLKD